MAAPTFAACLVGGPEASVEALVTEVFELKGVLDGAGSSQRDMLDALGRLQEHGALPTIVLSKTMIGKSVSQLAKTSAIEIVRTTASKLVCSWKQSHRKRKVDAAGLGAGTDQHVPIASSKVFCSAPGPPLAPSVQSLAVPRRRDPELESLECGKVDDSKNDETMTLQREKVSSKLKEALIDSGTMDGEKASPQHSSSRDPTTLASEIEATLWKDLRKGEKDYTNQVRAILFNLKDKKNPTFKSNILAGVIPVRAMSTMASADMASASKMAEREKAVEVDRARQEGIRDVLIAMGKAKGVPPTPPPSAQKGR